MPFALHLSGALIAATLLAVTIVYGGTDGLVPIVLAMAGYFALSWLFSELTVTVDERAIRWHFRRGWLPGSVIIPEVREAETIYVSWLYGYGIRWAKGGRLYRAWGLDVVRLTCENRRPIFSARPTLRRWCARLRKRRRSGWRAWSGAEALPLSRSGSGTLFPLAG
ncbi:MAG: hypothetical protein HC779_01660 [Phyllobacteriaceae bacterium]|nr:hypothetical protein [Phyllobacteriaceae bacterium]